MRNYYFIVFCLLAAPGVSIAQCQFEAGISGTDIKCHGDYTGKATIVVDPVGGNTGPYTFKWFDDDNRQSRDDLPAGTHFVKITDANGCFINEFITLEEPQLLSATYIKKDALCFNDPSGEVDLSPSGGMIPYSYQWSNGETTEDVSLLLAATYDVTVKDANFCQTSLQIIIEEPEALGISPTIIPTSCPLGIDGVIKAVVFGGTLPYTYSWSTGQAIPNITNLIKGNYTLIITDGNACQLTEIYAVPEPPPLAISFETTEVSCYGKSDGDLLALVTGGTPGYRYQWSNSDFVLGDTTSNPNKLYSDVYNLKVTDLNGCTKVAEIELKEPEPFVLNLSATPASCFKKADGSVDLTVSGGREPYSYLWSNGVNTQDASQLLFGNYSVVVTDFTGCGQLAKITIEQPDSLDFQVEVEEVSCKDQDDGEIKINPIGGTGPYSADWNTGSNEYHITDLVGNANYTVLLTDGNNCIYTGVFEININPRDCIAPISIPTAFTPNGDGINDFWQIENYEVYPNFHLDVFNKWGGRVFTSNGYSEPWDGTNNKNHLPPSTYYYIINLGNGDPIVSGYVIIVR